MANKVDIPRRHKDDKRNYHRLRFKSISDKFHVELKKHNYLDSVPVVAAGYWNEEEKRLLWYVSSKDDSKNKDDPPSDYLPELWVTVMQTVNAPAQSYFIKSTGQDRIITDDPKKIEELEHELEVREDLIKQIAVHVCPDGVTKSQTDTDKEDEISSKEPNLDASKSEVKSNKTSIKLDNSQINAVIGAVCKHNQDVLKVIGHLLRVGVCTASCTLLGGFVGGPIGAGVGMAVGAGVGVGMCVLKEAIERKK